MQPNGRVGPRDPHLHPLLWICLWRTEVEVISLSGDAVPIEKVGLVYTGRVAMAKSNIEVENGRQVRLSPGMNVTVEIKTGQRRLIEYFLSPLLRGVKEAARER